MSMHADINEQRARLDLTVPTDVDGYRALVLSMPGAGGAIYSDPFDLYSEELLAFFAEMGALRARGSRAARRGARSMRKRKISMKKIRAHMKRFFVETF